jgi:hypothetical protein
LHLKHNGSVTCSRTITTTNFGERKPRDLTDRLLTEHVLAGLEP